VIDLEMLVIADFLLFVYLSLESKADKSGRWTDREMDGQTDR